MSQKSKTEAASGKSRRPRAGSRPELVMDEITLTAMNTGFHLKFKDLAYTPVAVVHYNPGSPKGRENARKKAGDIVQAYNAHDELLTLVAQGKEAMESARPERKALWIKRAARILKKICPPLET